ncbi:NAD(P)-binding protein [Fomes fomentarius]|nr:NAD(P)-binding protein [Fomes fomentarius]
MPLAKPLALVLGATGQTGKSIVSGLLGAGEFRVAAAVRPSSLSKPAVEALRQSGVEIRVADIGDDVESLKKAFKDVSVVISAVDVPGIPLQKNAILAAKEAGVRRFVPNDFATPGARGVRELHDAKYEIHDLIEEVGLPYTYIDVGFWAQGFLPLPLRSNAPEFLKKITWSIVEGGEAPSLLTERDRIGIYVARIVADSRTLNRSVIVWDDEVTQLEAFELGERLSGEGDTLKAQRVYETKEDVLNAIATAKAERAKQNSTYIGDISVSWNLYRYSVFILRENTLENAKKLGYLDVRELYPDITPLPLAQYAKIFYGLTDPIIVMYNM